LLLFWDAPVGEAGCGYVVIVFLVSITQGDKAMVILLVQYNIRPEKAAEYATWVEAKLPVALNTPGIVEIKGYSNITGDHQVTALDVFEDLSGFATWWANEAVVQIFAELRQYADNVHTELLGPLT
jgi:antibiotic biosynthesis monooxygenase (ABM) superfamily enzyme